MTGASVQPACEFDPVRRCLVRRSLGVRPVEPRKGRRNRLSCCRLRWTRRAWKRWPLLTWN